MVTAVASANARARARESARRFTFAVGHVARSDAEARRTMDSTQVRGASQAPDPRAVRHDALSHDASATYRGEPPSVEATRAHRSVVRCMRNLLINAHSARATRDRIKAFCRVAGR